MPSNYLILCRPPSPPSAIFHSIRAFSRKSALPIKWPKYWSFSISPSNEYSGLISFRIDWFVLLAVQGTLKSLLQHHNLKASFLQHSAFFMVQLPHTYVTIGKNQSFHYMDICWQSNMLSRLVIAFLPRSKHLLISWLQSPSAVILEPKNIKIFGEVEKISFITFPGRRGQSKHLPWKMACPHLGGTGEGFYSNGQG